MHVVVTDDRALVWGTDFTQNDFGKGLRPVTTDWCPPNLARKTLFIEFYGVESANFVRDKGMSKGQFWSLRNVRLKTGIDGYLEANFSEVRKAIQLEENDVEHDTHFRDLLE